jgi:DNA-binding NarL/FixJ family response regulator
MTSNDNTTEDAAADEAAPPARPIRVIVVDDHALVREGLVSLLEPQPDLLVVGQAGSMRDAIRLAHSVRPDVVLMDSTLPDGMGDEATRVILSALPDTKIVFLTVHDDDERLFAAIAAGAVGYLLKSVRSADLLSLLRSVAHGDVALSPTIGRRILEKFSHLPTLRPVEQLTTEALTEREVEVLRLIVQGYTNRQIANALSLSVRTVEYHRANLTSKLGVHSRVDLVRYATKHGLLDAKAS